MKKMTCKEFKSVLEETLNMHFDIWGWEGILNELIIARRATAEESRKMGFERIAEKEEKQANDASDYLLIKGYYDN